MSLFYPCLIRIGTIISNLDISKVIHLIEFERDKSKESIVFFFVSIFAISISKIPQFFDHEEISNDRASYPAPNIITCSIFFSVMELFTKSRIHDFLFFTTSP